MRKCYLYMYMYVLNDSLSPSLPMCKCSYLSDGVGYLLHCLKREKERPSAFRAMGPQGQDGPRASTQHHQEQPTHWQGGCRKVREYNV